MQKAEEAKKAQIFYFNKGNNSGELKNNKALKDHVLSLPLRQFMPYSLVCPYLVVAWEPMISYLRQSKSGWITV